jgi:hypothetical protein
MQNHAGPKEHEKEDKKNMLRTELVRVCLVPGASNAGCNSGPIGQVDFIGNFIILSVLSSVQLCDRGIRAPDTCKVYRV